MGANLPQSKGFFIQMAKHFSVISGRVLHLMNEHSVHGGAFKCKEKNLGVLL